MLLVSGPTLGTCGPIGFQNLASGKLTKLSFRDWSSARRSHFSTWSTCLRGAGWSAACVGRCKGEVPFPQTQRYEKLPPLVRLCQDQGGWPIPHLTSLFWPWITFSIDQCTCWNQKETLHERVNTMTDRFASFAPGCFDACINSYITKNIHAYLSIHIYAIFNIIFTHLRTSIYISEQ